MWPRHLSRELPGSVDTPARQVHQAVRIAWRHQRWVRSVRRVKTSRSYDPRPLPQFRLYAVVNAWAEEDIIESTVLNAFAQGCDRVYLLDNDSPDGTVEAARTAGAELAGRYRTSTYSEGERLNQIHRILRRIAAQERRFIWWLLLDADELPHGPSGLTVRGHLQQLDRRYNVVGSVTFNHYPTGKPEHIRLRHPADYQPLCAERWEWNCSAGHWKHPLLRSEPGGRCILPGAGFHRVLPTRDRLLEPPVGIFVHHFHYRAENETRRRYRLLSAARPRPRTDGAPQAMRDRAMLLDAVYARKWAELPQLNPGGGAVNPRPWPEVVDPVHAEFVRWYDDSTPRPERNTRGGLAGATEP